MNQYARNENDLKCCGNCRRYDIILDEGGVCFSDDGKYPVEHDAVCYSWQCDNKKAEDRK